MNKMNKSELTARINRFMDRKVSKMINVSDLSANRVRHSPRHLIDVSDSPYIMLAVK